MKKIFSIILTAVLGLSITGCYDDSKLQEDISDLQKRVSQLELLCSQMNNNIVSMQTIVNSLNNNDYITSVAPIKNGDQVIGYTIAFLKQQPITIYNGEKGKDGENGTTPQIGVKQDTDGIWYWTLGNDWLLDSNGQKVRASGLKGDKGEDGEDAIAPQLKIVDGYWYISTDGGNNWSNIGKATGKDGKDGKDGDSMFKSVTYDDKYAYFTLVNGTVLTVPLSTNVPKLQFTLDKETDIHLTGGGSVVLNYTIAAPSGAKTTFTSYESNNWKVDIKKTNATKGTITITAPNPVESGKIMLVLSDDFGNVFMKTLEIIGDDNVIKIIKTEYTIDEYGGYIDVAVEANLGFVVQILDGGDAWISTVSTGTTTRLSVSANPEYSSRTATVRFKGNDGETYKDISITQLQNNAIVVSSNNVSITEYAQTYNLVVRANVDCNISIPSEATWIKNVTTKALVDKTFNLSISENEDYGSRSAVIVVSDATGKIKQTITFTQDGYTPIYVTIPDATFLACLTETYDINGDGKIDQKEAAKITSIVCSGKSIASLAGIENFTNLTTLDCSKTQITSLDISANTKLTSITCQNNEQMVSLNLPPVSSISERAFLGCTSLAELDLPNTINSIGKDAFLNCSSLKKLTISSDINNTYTNAFSGAAVQDLRIAGNVTRIVNSMFSGCSTLKTVTIGENVETIGYLAFANCLNLQSVVFDKYSKLRTIDYGCFHGSTKLADLNLANCTEVKTITTAGGSYKYMFGGHSASPALVISLGTRTPPSLKATGSYQYSDICYAGSSNFDLTLKVPEDCIDAYKASSWHPNYVHEYVTIVAL